MFDTLLDDLEVDTGQPTALYIEKLGVKSASIYLSRCDGDHLRVTLHAPVCSVIYARDRGG